VPAASATEQLNRPEEDTVTKMSLGFADKLKGDVAIKVTTPITHQTLWDVLSTSVDAGTLTGNYLVFEDHHVPKGREDEVEFCWVDPPFAGGYVTVRVMDPSLDSHPDEDEEKWERNTCFGLVGMPRHIDLDMLCLGMQTLANKYPRQMAEIVSEGGGVDVIVADVFLQCCLFGEVIYG
jgi:hypothetical protein